MRAQERQLKAAWKTSAISPGLSGTRRFPVSLSKKQLRSGRLQAPCDCKPFPSAVPSRVLWMYRARLQPLVAPRSQLKPALHRGTSPSAWHVHVPHSLPQLTQGLLRAPRCGKLWHFSPRPAAGRQSCKSHFPRCRPSRAECQTLPVPGQGPSHSFQPYFKSNPDPPFSHPLHRFLSCNPNLFLDPSFLPIRTHTHVLVHACIHTHNCP